MAYAVLAVAYNLTLPIGEAPDEQTHLDYVYYLQRHHRLPTLTSANGDGITQGGHPPVYYALAAALVAGMDPSPPTFVTNPHFTFNRERTLVPNRYVHEPGLRFPYRGAPGVLAVHVMRLVSLLGGLLAVTAAYAIGREVWPGAPAIAWTAAAMVAFLPGFTSLSGAFNNDMLASGLAGWVLLGALRMAGGKLGLRGTLVTGLVWGMAMLTKMTVIYLAPVLGLAVVAGAYQTRRWRGPAAGGAAAGLGAMAITAWWFARNIRHYGAGDPTGWKAFVAAAPELLRTIPLRVELLDYWWLQFTTLVGAFGWMSVFLPTAVYVCAFAVVLVAIVGAGRLVLGWQRLPGQTRWGLAVLAVAVAAAYVSVFRLALVYNLVVAQGRYLYIALPGAAVLLASGLLGPVSEGSRTRVGAVTAAAAGAFSLGCLIFVVAPAFRPPRVLSVQEAASVTHAVGADFGGRIRLVGYDLSVRGEAAPEPPAARPGDELVLQLYWTGLPANATGSPAEAERTFAHVVDAAGEVVARIDLAPFGGRYPTSAWRPDQVLRQTFTLRLADDATPGRGAILVGVYPEGRPTARLTVSLKGVPLSDAYRIDPFLVEDVAPATPNPVLEPPLAVFGQPPMARLLRADVAGQGADDAPGPRPGTTLTVTLSWQSIRRQATDYTVFVHLDGPDGPPLATADAPPEFGRFPTSLWVPGEVVRDVHRLLVPPSAAGPTALRVGIYDPETGARLPAGDASGRSLPDDAATIPYPWTPGRDG